MTDMRCRRARQAKSGCARRVRSRATTQTRRAPPAEFANGFWKSGDLGYLDEDGYLFIVDRKKDMIITGGFNVYAIEVEAALSEHPAVLMSAVVGVPHAEWGETVHAEVILRREHEVSADELIAHAKGKIGSYKAPKTIKFVGRTASVIASARCCVATSASPIGRDGAV